jgi:hypothetical protein
MAKKKIIQAKIKQKSKFSLFEDKHPLATAALMIAVLVVGFIGYNKFLDYRNVQDMKGLLSDFQQLELDIEAETGEEFYIEADCGRGSAKFSSSYTCTARLYASNGWASTYNNFASNNKLEDKGCELLSKSSVGFDKSEDHYRCRISVRPSSQQKSEEIFYDYDTSPGWPL